MNEEYLGKKEQKRLKSISKVIYVLAKIAKIFVIIGIVFFILGMSMGIGVLGNINVKNDHQIEFKAGDKSVQYLEQGDGVFITADGQSQEITGKDDKEAVKKVARFFFDHSKESIIILLVLVLVVTTASMVLAFLGLRELERLFKNINEESTPFIEENVEHLKKITIYMIIEFVLSLFGNGAIDSIADTDISMNFGVSLTTILFLGALIYIFKYGCMLQDKSDMKIYE